MMDGAVIVDISVDQGGCIETTRPTTYDAPTFIEEGVTHFCVANMPVQYLGRLHKLYQQSYQRIFIVLHKKAGVKKILS